jgi:hypothetical protein
MKQIAHPFNTFSVSKSYTISLGFHSFNVFPIYGIEMIPSVCIEYYPRSFLHAIYTAE